MDEIKKKLLFNSKEVLEMSDEEQNEYWETFKEYLDERFKHALEEDKRYYRETLENFKDFLLHVEEDLKAHTIIHKGIIN